MLFKSGLVVLHSKGFRVFIPGKKEKIICILSSLLPTFEFLAFSLVFGFQFKKYNLF